MGGHSGFILQEMQAGLETAITFWLKQKMQKFFGEYSNI